MRWGWIRCANQGGTGLHFEEAGLGERVYAALPAAAPAAAASPAAPASPRGQQKVDGDAAVKIKRGERTVEYGGGGVKIAADVVR